MLLSHFLSIRTRSQHSHLLSNEYVFRVVVIHEVQSSDLFHTWSIIRSFQLLLLLLLGPGAGGGCKHLFRKIGNRSSEFHPDENEVRRNGSYIYEEFLETQGTDVKMYTYVSFCCCGSISRVLARYGLSPNGLL